MPYRFTVADELRYPTDARIGGNVRTPLGKWLIPLPTFQNTISLQFADGAGSAIPLELGGNVTFDRMAVLIGNASGSAGSVARLGLYADDGTGYPASLVLDAGTVTTAATAGTIQAATIAQPLSPGMYWVVAVQQGSASTSALLCGMDNTVTITIPTVRWNSTGDPRVRGYGIAIPAGNIVGALPTMFPAGLSVSMQAAQVSLRRSA